jgi:hypothetical protein
VVFLSYRLAQSFDLHFVLFCFVLCRDMMSAHVLYDPDSRVGLPEVGALACDANDTFFSLFVFD